MTSHMNVSSVAFLTAPVIVTESPKHERLMLASRITMMNPADVPACLYVRLSKDGGMEITALGRMEAE